MPNLLNFKFEVFKKMKISQFINVTINYGRAQLVNSGVRMGGLFCKLASSTSRCDRVAPVLCTLLHAIIYIVEGK